MGHFFYSFVSFPDGRSKQSNQLQSEAASASFDPHFKDEEAGAHGKSKMDCFDYPLVN